MPKKYDELRNKMDPKSRERARQKANEMLKELDTIERAIPKFKSMVKRAANLLPETLLYVCKDIRVDAGNDVRVTFEVGEHVFNEVICPATGDTGREEIKYIEIQNFSYVMQAWWKLCMEAAEYELDRGLSEERDRLQTLEDNYDNGLF